MTALWSEHKLGDLIQINPDTLNKTYPYSEIEYLDITSVRTGFYTEVRRLKLEEAPSRAKRLVSDGDTIISTVRPGNKSYCFLKKTTPKMVVSTGFAVLRAKKDLLDERFLYYLVSNPSFTEYLVAHEKGAAYPAVGIETLENAVVSIPDLSTQKKISDVLGSLDDKIELNRRINETLEQMAMALYKHWFVDFGPFQDGEFVESEMGMIPQGWTVQQLGDLVSIQTSSINPARNEKSLFLHYSIPAYDEKKLPKLEKGSEIKSNKYIIRRNSILVSKLNPETYRIWTVFAEPSQYERICSTEFIVYEPKNENTWAFLNAYLRDEPFKNEFRSHAAGTTGSRQRVSPRKTLEFKLIVPPDSVLEQFNRICSDYFKIQHKNTSENEILTDIRDYLLPRLLSGEIEVREAEEQVEEVLANG